MDCIISCKPVHESTIGSDLVCSCTCGKDFNDPATSQRGCVVVVKVVIKLESLTIIRELGVQIQTKYYSGKQTQLFIDKKRIKSVIINEGIKSFSVLFYMAFVVDKNKKMILAFQVNN